MTLSPHPQNLTEFTDEYLRDVVLNFIIAGRDTTACAMTWMVLVLGQQPKLADVIREELAAVGDPAFVDYATSFRMPKTTAIFFETCRLYPPVPNDGPSRRLSRHLLRPDRALPRATAASADPSLMSAFHTSLTPTPTPPSHRKVRDQGRSSALGRRGSRRHARDVRHFHDEPQPCLLARSGHLQVRALARRSGRGLSLPPAPLVPTSPASLPHSPSSPSILSSSIPPPSQLREFDAAQYPTFNAMPRLCLGKPMATFEAVSLLAALVRNFDFELPSYERGAPKFSVSLTLASKDGLRVVFKPRPGVAPPPPDQSDDEAEHDEPVSFSSFSSSVSSSTTSASTSL